MKTRTAWLLCILALAGCKTWATADVHKVTVNAPSAVNRGEKLFFTVEVKDLAGKSLDGIPFQWKVDWEGLEGSYHKGKAGVEQKINVKGAPGSATLTIFGYNDKGEVVELAKHGFKVE